MRLTTWSALSDFPKSMKREGSGKTALFSDYNISTAAFSFEGEPEKTKPTARSYRFTQFLDSYHAPSQLTRADGLR